MIQAGYPPRQQLFFRQQAGILESFDVGQGHRRVNSQLMNICDHGPCPRLPLIRSIIATAFRLKSSRMRYGFISAFRSARAWSRTCWRSAASSSPIRLFELGQRNSGAQRDLQGLAHRQRAGRQHKALRAVAGSGTAKRTALVGDRAECAVQKYFVGHACSAIWSGAGFRR